MPLDNISSLDGELTRPNSGSAKIPTHFVRGTIIGSYEGEPIYDQLTDNHGVVRLFGGIAVPKAHIKPGGVVVRPGILYEPA
jgi:hypothetical protein